MPSAVCPQTLDMPTPPPHLLCAAPPSPPPAPGVAPAGAAALSQDDLKRIAAHRAVELVAPGMTLGLGTGSTAAHALDRIGELLRLGKLQGVVGVPTSLKTEAHARRVGIPLVPLAEDAVAVHLSIDGADEVDAELNLVKGRGIQTMSTPNVWSEKDIDYILGQFGTFIVERAGTDVDEALASLQQYRDNIYVIQQLIQNDVSSTKIRLFLRRGMSVQYLIPAPVVEYIEHNHLFEDDRRGSTTNLAYESQNQKGKKPEEPSAASSST